MDGGEGGWMIHDTAGWVFASPTVFAVAAAQPLINGYNDGIYRFNRSRFIARVLESPPVANPQ
jgi:hypothetical protein